ncbi:hypothetical protein PG984_012869 [Apiospora sp. TS-2023a]
MKIETQPPTVLQAGVAMKQPLAISDAQYDFLHAVLVDLPGEVVAGTSEPVTSPNAGRASFLDLTISGLGQYKIRVDAYTIDYQRSDCPMSTHKASVMSHEFIVQELPVDGGNPGRANHVA